MSFLPRVFTKWYFGKLTDRLARSGLTYHDAIAETGVYEKAVSRLPANIQAERVLRMKRAMDMSAKHTEVPPSLQVCLRHRSLFLFGNRYYVICA